MRRKTSDKSVDVADTNLQVWCRRTELATLVLWYESGGTTIHKRSQLGKMVIEDMIEMIAKSGFEVVRETAEAIGILRERGLGELNPEGRGERVLLERLQLESKPQKRNMANIEEEIIKGAKQFLSKQKPQEKVPTSGEEQDWSTDNLRRQLGTVPEGIVVKTDERSELSNSDNNSELGK